MQASKSSEFFWNSEILTIKLGPTDIVSKMIFCFFGGGGGEREGEDKCQVICYQFECTILHLYCYLAKFLLTAAFIFAMIL